MASLTFAAIDVGSFELELGIYEISSKNRIRKLDHVRHVIALGNETYRDGKISYEMVEEICQVLGDFTRIMKSYRVMEYRAYATSAMREARNSQIVLDQIRVRTGIEVRIISNSEQRFLTYKAIAVQDEAFDKNIRKGTAIVDVGFGSMQISLFDDNLLVSTANLPLGVLRINSTINNLNTTVDRIRDVIEEMVTNELNHYKNVYLDDRKVKHVIGIGENILYMFRKEDDGKPLTRVSRDRFGEFYEQLCLLNRSQMEERFGVSADYAALLLPSAIIYKEFLEMTGAEMIWIPGVSLCDGIAAEYATDHKMVRLKHNFNEDIISASRNIARRYRCVSPHSEQVEKYALTMFDTMKRYHGMGERERLLLQIAVIIHGCGKFISVRNASECAYNIVMSTEIIGISHLEREIIANVLRYNVRDFDYDRIRMETELDAVSGNFASYKEVTILIAKLTAILRLADSMDRGHKQKLRDCKMAVKEGKLLVNVNYHGDISLDALAFEQRSGFFEEIFGIRPVLKQKRSI